MAYTFLAFDFGADEEAAQRAKQTVDRWKQAFRLDKKLLLKFDREAADKKASSTEKPASRKKAGAGKGDSAGEDNSDERILILVRLDFSEHEKLSHQRWLDRIPTEEVFKKTHPRVIRPGDEDFGATAEKFEELD
jgi:hypothetical protein